MSATLFWKVSNQDHVNQRLKRNLDHILKFKPELAKLFEGTKDKVEHFLNLFFPSLETIGYVANLSLEDKSFQKILLLYLENSAYSCLQIFLYMEQELKLSFYP